MVQKRNNLELDIIESLIDKNNHVRAIAKLLGESHSTVLRKLDGLAKLNVVDHYVEGKNKIFFIKENLIAKSFIFEAELNKRIKLFEKYPELMIIFEDILEKTKAKLIVIFGSYAKNIAKKSSDVDIYIETTNNEIKDKIEAINSNLSVKIGKFNKNSFLIKEIIKNHVIIRGVEEFYEK